MCTVEGDGTVSFIPGEASPELRESGKVARSELSLSSDGSRVCWQETNFTLQLRDVWGSPGFRQMVNMCEGGDRSRLVPSSLVAADFLGRFGPFWAIFGPFLGSFLGQFGRF